MERNKRTLLSLNWRWAHEDALKCVTRDNMLAYYRKVGCTQNVPAPSSTIQQQQQEMAALAAMVAILPRALGKRQR